MARIDVQTLVLAFEKRIEALERNPPDKVKTSVIINMLESSIDEIIKDHFLVLVKREIEETIKNEFEKLKTKFVKDVIRNILRDVSFKSKLENELKDKFIGVISDGY